VKPVFNVIEHLHRDRAVADDAVAGRFTCTGETLELGTPPDWFSDALPADEEWRIEWVKFYYGLDLAHAYEASGDERYRAAWEALVGSFLRQVPAAADPSEVTARRIVNWIYAWQGFGSLSNELGWPLAERIGAEARHVRATLTPERNHRTLELYALAMVGFAFADAELRDLAIAGLDENLAADFRPDGVHRESSTHYHMIALRSFVGLAENARRHGVALPDGYEERLSRACDFALHCRRPDGTIPALSDADSEDYGALLALAADVLGRDDLRRDPTELPGAAFPDGGYWTQRRDDRFLIFDCGPLGDGGHGHYDLLSVEAWAGGRPLLVDPGRFTYDEGPPNLRHWFKGTAAHNTVCVDGRDQTAYARKAPRGPVADGHLLGRTDATLSGEARSPEYEAVHRRRVAFDGREWAIEDELSGESEHSYDLRLHLGPGDARVDGTTVVADAVALTIGGADRITVEPGWVSPLYGVRHKAPVISAVSQGRDARFHTRVVPR
jgi:uncharacterized heparinase superfamily protein